MSVGAQLVPKQHADSTEAPETLSECLDPAVTAFAEPCLVQRQIL